MTEGKEEREEDDDNDKEKVEEATREYCERLSVGGSCAMGYACEDEFDDTDWGIL